MLLTCWAALAVLTTMKTQTNVPVEIEFHAAKVHRDPFNELTLDVTWTGPDGKALTVPAFWDGGSLWKVRFASPHAGTFHFRTICSDPSDSGLSHREGNVQITPYKGKNPLYKHGPIQIAPDKRHLQHSDGTPFFWLADTWWMGLAQRLHWPDEFKTLTADRVEKGFNVVQLVAGLYPDSFPFDLRGANEAGFPWEPDYARINPAYFDRADDRIRHLVEQGIAPCIVGAWGYFIEWTGTAKMEQHWRNLIARYGAYPVVWCGAGEGNLPWYLDPKFPYVQPKQIQQWTEVMRYIRKTDPYHRPLTIHPTAVSSYTSRSATEDPALLDFDMLQTPHGQESAAEVAERQTRESYAAGPKMPVIDGEAAYEMLGDSLPTRWTRAMFWICMLNGAAGHTYGANGIWQNNRPNDPHGKSPHGAMYGKITSQEAMHLPGSAQVGMGKRLFEKYPWSKFEPHPEWATYAANETGATLDKSHWIWFPEGDPSVDAPAETRFLRREFSLSETVVKEAELVFSADDKAFVYLNGAEVGHTSDWRTGARVKIPANLLRSGPNVLAARVENVPAEGIKNPAGFIATLHLHLADSPPVEVPTDRSWKASKSESPNWNLPAFGDAQWPSAAKVADYGSGPWHNIGDSGSKIGPQCAGIEGGVRILYMLRQVPVEVSHLKPHAHYAVKLFDPVTGRTRNLGTVQADEAGKWTANPPQSWEHDWVLVMEPL